MGCSIAELIINSPDTDEFLLLVYYQTKLCNKTLFSTGRGKDVRSIAVKNAYESIGPKQPKALLGYHSFSGSDFVSLMASPSWQHRDTLTVPPMLRRMPSHS